MHTEEQTTARLNAGAKGIGEIALAGVPFAILNAVCNATGKRIWNFAVKPDKLLA